MVYNFECILCLGYVALVCIFEHITQVVAIQCTATTQRQKQCLHIAVPTLPKSASFAGKSGVPHVHHLQIVLLQPGITLCALPVIECTTTILTSCIGIEELEDDEEGWHGTSPSPAGLQPERKAERIVERAFSSVTPAAASYSACILEPLSQCPSTSISPSTIRPKDLSCCSAVTRMCRNPCGCYIIASSTLMPQPTTSKKCKDRLRSE